MFVNVIRKPWPWGVEASHILDHVLSISSLYDPDNIIGRMDEIILHSENKSILLAGVTGTGKYTFARAIAKKYIGNDHSRFFYYSIGKHWTYDNFILGMKINSEYHPGHFTKACLAAENQPDKLVFLLVQQMLTCDAQEIFSKDVYTSLDQRDKLISTKLGLKLIIPHNLVIINTLTLGEDQPSISKEAQKVFHTINVEPNWSIEHLQKYSNTKNERMKELIEVMANINNTLRQEGLPQHQIGTRFLHELLYRKGDNIIDKDVNRLVERYALSRSDIFYMEEEPYKQLQEIMEPLFDLEDRFTKT